MTHRPRPKELGNPSKPEYCKLLLISIGLQDCPHRLYCLLILIQLIWLLVLSVQRLLLIGLSIGGGKVYSHSQIDAPPAPQVVHKGGPLVDSDLVEGKHALDSPPRVL